MVPEVNLVKVLLHLDAVVKVLVAVLALAQVSNVNGRRSDNDCENRPSS